jgi:hypothetical protein
MPIRLARWVLSLGNAKVEGFFDGTVRQEQREGKTFLIINGIMTYDFYDKFSDPFEKIERTQRRYDITREEAERMVGDEVDEAGEPYDITGQWQTKLNATFHVR